MRTQIWLLVACLSWPIGCRREEVSHSSTAASQLEEMISRGRGDPYVQSESADDARIFAYGLGTKIYHKRMNPITGALAYADFETKKMPVVAEDKAADAGLAVVSENSHAFKVKIADLKPLDRFRIEVSDKIVAFQYQRYVDGLAVDGSLLQLNFVRVDGGLKLRDIVNRTYGDIDVEGGEDEASLSFAAFAEKYGRSDHELIEEESLIFPQLADDFTFFRAKRFTYRDKSTEEVFVVTVRNDGQLLAAESLFRETTRQWQVVTGVYKEHQDEATTVDAPVPGLELTIDGTDHRVDDSGSATFEADGGSEVRVSFNSDVVNVYEDTQGRPYEMTVTIPEDGGELRLDSDSPSKDNRSYANIYVTLHEIKEFVSERVSSSDLAFLDRPIRARANKRYYEGRPFDCNAYYFNNSITFAPESDRCANTGNLKGVVIHEVGHHLFSLSNPRGAGDFNEGSADILSMLMMDTPKLGEGFFKDSSRTPYLRSLDNQLKYPQDRKGEVHADGLFIGGAFWRLREGLIKKHGEEEGKKLTEQFFFRGLRNARSYLDFYRTIVRLDDDDQDPTTRSTNQCVANRAFSVHGLAEADPECDKEEETTPKIEEDRKIFMRILSEKKDKAKLEIAVSEGERVALCLGDRETCLAEDAETEIWFDRDEEVDEYSSFVSKKSLDLSDESSHHVTLTTRDKDGAIIGYREVKFEKEE